MALADFRADRPARACPTGRKLRRGGMGVQGVMRASRLPTQRFRYQVSGSSKLSDAARFSIWEKLPITVNMLHSSNFQS